MMMSRESYQVREAMGAEIRPLFFFFLILFSPGPRCSQGLPLLQKRIRELILHSRITVIKLMSLD